MTNQISDEVDYPARYWVPQEGDRIQCRLCPRVCSIKDGSRGFCFVRQNRGNKLVLTTYGRSSGFCIDPIEKKPLNHFFPGTPVLSFGTAGCNLGCRFCQNWDISKSKELDRLMEQATPEAIAIKAVELGCDSVAFTYNDPVIFAEYAIDIAHACHERGVNTVAVTAGYIMEEPRQEFYGAMDAANVDLKAFTREFYKKLCMAELQPVLETLLYLKHETDVWFEITNLVIPEENDDEREFHEMCEWIVTNLGPDVPVHFTAFHPDFKLQYRPATPPKTLINARNIALSKGINYPYTGNIFNETCASTYCPNCSQVVIERDWYQLGQYNIKQSSCKFCGGGIPGRFNKTPGKWGRRRVPVSFGK